MSDLPALVAELRAARPELAGELPTYPHGGWWQLTWADEHSGLRALVGEEQARRMVIGVCAEVLAKAGRSLPLRIQGTDQWHASGGDIEPDFTTALVRATLAAKGEGKG